MREIILHFQKIPIPKEERPLWKPPAPGAFGAFSKKNWRFSLKQMCPPCTTSNTTKQARRRRKEGRH